MAQVKREHWEPMKSAPRDGTVILIRARGHGVLAAYYLDCGWLREPCPETGEPGDPSIRDCWRCENGHKDIELRSATGWRRSANIES